MIFFLLGYLSFLDDLLNDKPSVSVCLVDLNSSSILFEKNAHEKKNPYSTTKLATALFLLENYPVNLQKVIQVNPKDLIELKKEEVTSTRKSKSDASVMGLEDYDFITIEALLYGMLLPSGCDAANVIASSYEKTIDRFVIKMNAYLKKIGCRDTYFINPHGYPDSLHKTTAYDLAIIGQQALKKPFLKQIFNASSKEIPITSSLGEPRKVSLEQKNKFLLEGKYYNPNVYGIKTGSSLPFSHNLVVAAKQNHHDLLLVLLDAKTDHDRYTLCRKILDKTFEYLEN